jgi:arsenate reductase
MFRPSPDATMKKTYIKGGHMKNEKIKVLFVCVHNSFRSQIAEAILNHKYGDRFEAQSAGLKTTRIDPLAVEAMADWGLDISHSSVDDVSDFFNEGKSYSYIITVCDREAEKDCPLFPGVHQRINWKFEDPEAFEGSHEEKLKKALYLRDQIENKIDKFADVLGG